MFVSMAAMTLAVTAVAAAMMFGRLTAPERGEIDLPSRPVGEVLQVQDGVLQGLVATHTWMIMGHDAEARAALEHTMEATQEAIATLLGDHPLHAGDLVLAVPKALGAS